MRGAAWSAGDSGPCYDGRRTLLLSRDLAPDHSRRIAEVHAMRHRTATFLALALAAGTATAQLVPELIYYRFNEGAGTTTANLASPGAGSSAGTIIGAMGFGPGRFGSGLVGTGLPAASNYVQTGYSLNLQGQSWTIEFWLNTNPVTSLYYVLGVPVGGSFRVYLSSSTNGALYMTGSGVTTASILGAVPSAGTWVHAAWVFNAATTPPTITPCLNGVAAGPPVAQTGALTLNTGVFQVGAQIATGLNGTMDEFRLWLRARTAAEIAANFNVEVVNQNNLVATTTGGGAGDLNLSLSLVTPGATEGWLLVSGTTAGPPGSGPILGLWPDALTWSGFAQPSFPGNPFHFPVGFPGVFPDAPLVLPPGTLSNLAGTSLDVAALLLAGPAFAGVSLVNRLNW